MIQRRLGTYGKYGKYVVLVYLLLKHKSHTSHKSHNQYRNQETQNYDTSGRPSLSYRYTIATDRRKVCMVHSSLSTLQSSRLLW